MGRESIFALTSLVPSMDRVQLTRDCINSWRSAGLQVRAFNHPDEIDRLARLYDVEFVPVVETAAPVFGRHYVPIKVMLDWAADHSVPALVVNSDIQLHMADWEMKRVRWLSDGGLCYFVRFNHGGTLARAQPEPNGIDAFLFHGRDVERFPDSFLSMGQPFWDYWLPHAFGSRSRQIYTVEFPAALHRSHPQHWSWDNWHRCALEFGRITNELVGDSDFATCQAMSIRVRRRFDQHKTVLPPQPGQIRPWVERTFRSPYPKTFVELGAHQGTDTAWMAAIPKVTVHALEPDPRNHQPPRANVVLHRAAVADRDGRGGLILSLSGWGQIWTHSSSIKPPKNHLQRFPVSFGDPVEVDLVTLDTLYERHGLQTIDFIWADIQGAEGEMIRAGRRALAHTRYVYTGYSDDEMYEHQPTLKDMLELLPNFRVLELWPGEALLENRDLQQAG